MHRALPVSRRAVQRSARLRVSTRRHTFSTTSRASEDAAGPSTVTTPPKKRGFFRTLTLYGTGLLVLFYAGSPVAAFNNERYHAFFYESIPFGSTILDLAEENGWDDNLRMTFLQSTKDKLNKVYGSVTKSTPPATPAQTQAQADKAKETIRERAVQVKEATKEKVAATRVKVQETKERLKDSKERVSEVVQTLKTTTEKSVTAAANAVNSVLPGTKDAAATTSQAIIFSDGVEELVRRAEAALSGKPIDGLPEATTTTPDKPSAPIDAEKAEPKLMNAVQDSDGKLYTAALPLGFEPPPGYARPKPPAPPPPPESEKKPEPEALPLLAPAVAEQSASEPVIAELASTIDSLAAFLKENPSATKDARGVLATAEKDLKELAARIDQARTDERTRLEAQLAEQEREYTTRLLEMELSGQDKLDEQETEFRAFFEEERRKMVRQYREKLENELQAQSEIINERLKAEVIAQGIEMQRRWMRDIKVQVEQERGGRLARLEELATQAKKLERTALDSASYLDENLRLHALWAALRSLASTALDGFERRPFRDELRVLRSASRAASDKDPLVAVALDALDSTDVPDIGVEPLADLSTWLSEGVAPQVARVALVPEQGAGVLAHVASYVLSSLRFRRKGLVEGDDVLSVLARAEHYMAEKDLESATRELNQLRGPPKMLLHDWLEAARRRLEVLQAIEVVQTQATLESLLLV